MHINSISCGQGAPSLYLIVMAGEGIFPADVVITADTGWELDCLWSTGERTTAREYWEQVTKPLAEEFDLDAAWVRAVNAAGERLPAIQDVQEMQNVNGALGIDIPLYGSRGGQLMQACTSKWKINAIRQELRRRGAKTATTALGLTISETHRMKSNDVKWEQLRWPLIDARLHRATIVERLEQRGIPYLISTQCDGCPHKDRSLIRWNNTSSATITALAEWEKKFDGQFFLTSNRIPLIDSIDQMRRSESLPIFDDTCDSGYCFT